MRRGRARTRGQEAEDVHSGSRVPRRDGSEPRIPESWAEAGNAPAEAAEGLMRGLGLSTQPASQGSTAAPSQGVGLGLSTP